jgi:hypothetical protein
MPKNLLLLAINEINFGVVRNYLNDGNLPNFKKLFDFGVVETSSESSYEYLEPWIQWVSAHTGLSAKEHGVYRLGDIIGSDAVTQIFEEVEESGYTVGAISPMNASNRLSSPAYFIPDPWTKTPSDGGFWSESLSGTVSQAVNDNANQRISLKSYFYLLLGLIRFARPKNYFLYLKLAITSAGNSWRKALFLDLFLHDLHINLLRTSKCQFSTLFLNAGAHIQHHYFFNARHGVTGLSSNPEWYIAKNVDPFAEMLAVYDRIIGDYLAMNSQSLLIATGLSQMPYDRIKYYYRLSNHAKFLQDHNIDFLEVHPRMTRDFLITFKNNESAQFAEEYLAGITSADDGIRIFGEIDNRGDSLFVTLSYPNEIRENFNILQNGVKSDFAKYTSFVAIKNGMHNQRGYLIAKDLDCGSALSDGMHVKGIYQLIKSHFGIAAGLKGVIRQDF